MLSEEEKKQADEARRALASFLVPLLVSIMTVMTILDLFGYNVF